MLLNIIVFLFGLAIGSFLNVCIWRLPLDKSIVYPPSHCPLCRKHIFWYDNIPVLSFILLKGRCRSCKEKISFRYPLIELLTASIFLLFFTHFSLPLFFIYTLLGSLLIVATFTDFAHQIIPDQITLGGLAAGLFLSIIYPPLHGVVSTGAGVVKTSGLSLVSSLVGMLVGGGSIYLLGVIGSVIFRKEAMGGGDVKLMGMLGAFLGWKLVLLIFFIAPLFGSVVGIILKLKHKTEIIPYGPYLSLAAIITLIYGERIIRFLFG